MFELMVMRHAKSDWNSQAIDIDRPLSKRGLNDAHRMAVYMKNHYLLPDRLLVSSARRTQQTAGFLIDALKISNEHLIIDVSLYLASINTLLSTIKRYAKENQRLLVLAHNPGVDELVTYLADDEPALTASGKLMVTGALAVFRIDTLDGLNRPGQGTLLELIRPRDIA